MLSIEPRDLQRGNSVGFRFRIRLVRGCNYAVYGSHVVYPPLYDPRTLKREPYMGFLLYMDLVWD